MLTRLAAGIVWENVPDPDSPNRTIKRARRVDPLIAILSGGEHDVRRWAGIDRDRYQTAEWCRDQAAIAAGGSRRDGTGGRRNAWDYAPSEWMVDAQTAIRGARSAVGPTRVLVFDCVVLYGMSLREFAVQYRVRADASGQKVRDALDIVTAWRETA